MRRADQIFDNLDWVTILLYASLVFLGWLNIYAVTYEPNQSIFDLSLNSGRQLLFIFSSLILIVVILVLDIQFFDTFAYVIYGGTLVFLFIVLIVGKEVGGNQAWIGIGSFGVQPSEFAKFATALAIAKLMSSVGFKIDNLKNQITLFLVMGFPMALIFLQKDTGTALVFTSFILVFYREGLSPFLIILGLVAGVIFILTLLVENEFILYGGVGALLVFAVLIGEKKIKRIVLLGMASLLIVGMIQSVDYVLNNVLKPHQQNRVKALINPEADPLGYGWNVTQSKIAIGSGGFSGKGFLKGTQTKFDFVPEQSTDFIFCTIGEEHGWVGSFGVIALFIFFLLRLIFIAERQKSKFSRVYAYGVACIFFFHFTINIGMTVGLFPVIGIPLPFFSYGGSSLWGFTILLFILLKTDSYRMQVLQRMG